MGETQNNGQDASKGKRKRGSVRNADRLQAFASGGKEGQADWAGCNPERIQDVVAGITVLGGAVIFGMSRDQGSHQLTLLLDEKRKTLWFNRDADLDEELQAVVATLGQMD